MFVSCGKKRISNVTNTSDSVNASVLFAPHDGPARLHGYSPVPVTVSVGSGGQVTNYTYRSADGYFSFDFYPSNRLICCGSLPETIEITEQASNFPMTSLEIAKTKL
jgi:hypothetical protein